MTALEMGIEQQKKHVEFLTKLINESYKMLVQSMPFDGLPREIEGDFLIDIGHMILSAHKAKRMIERIESNLKETMEGKP